MAATANFDTVDNTMKLNEDDFRDVTEEIRRLHSEFYAVGRELGIRPSDLDAIKRDSSLSYEDKLNQVVLLWLRERYNIDKFGIPTWRRLVEAVNRIRPALAKDIVRHLQAGGRTATRVAEPSSSHTKAPHRYVECETLQQFTALLNSAITDPDVFAAHLVQYQFTNQETANSICNVLGVSKYHMVGRLLGVVDSHLKTAGVVSPEHVGTKFRMFLSILDVALGLHDLSKQMLNKCYDSSESPKTQVFQPSERVKNHSAGTIGTTSTTTSNNTSTSTTGASSIGKHSQHVEMNPGMARAVIQHGAGVEPPQLTFSVDMTNDDFITFMKNEGLQDRDASKLTEHCIGAKVFLELTDEDIKDPSLGFSFGGKKVIKRVLKLIKETETPVTDNMMPSVSVQMSPMTNATLPTTQQQPNSSASDQTPQSVSQELSS